MYYLLQQFIQNIRTRRSQWKIFENNMIRMIHILGKECVVLPKQRKIYMNVLQSKLKEAVMW